MLHKYDFAVIKAIVNTDPRVCKVRNGSDWLPVETVFKSQMKSAQSSSFVYEELPSTLLDLLFEKMQPYEQDPAIHPYSIGLAI